MLNDSLSAVVQTVHRGESAAAAGAGGASSLPTASATQQMENGHSGKKDKLSSIALPPSASFSSSSSSSVSSPPFLSVRHRFAASSFTPLVRQCWIPDKERMRCAINNCAKEFTFTRRRHHCRACGDVFCEDCSSYRLTGRDSLHIHEMVTVRVCLPCFETHSLKEGETLHVIQNRGEKNKNTSAEHSDSSSSSLNSSSSSTSSSSNSLRSSPPSHPSGSVSPGEQSEESYYSRYQETFLSIMPSIPVLLLQLFLLGLMKVFVPHLLSWKTSAASAAIWAVVVWRNQTIRWRKRQVEKRKYNKRKANEENKHDDKKEEKSLTESKTSIESSPPLSSNRSSSPGGKQSSTRTQHSQKNQQQQHHAVSQAHRSSNSHSASVSTPSTPTAADGHTPPVPGTPPSHEHPDVAALPSAPSSPPPLPDQQPSPELPPLPPLPNMPPLPDLPQQNHSSNGRKSAPHSSTHTTRTPSTSSASGASSSTPVGAFASSVHYPPHVDLSDLSHLSSLSSTDKEIIRRSRLGMGAVKYYHAFEKGWKLEKLTKKDGQGSVSVKNNQEKKEWAHEFRQNPLEWQQTVAVLTKQVPDLMQPEKQRTVWKGLTLLPIEPEILFRCYYHPDSFSSWNTSLLTNKIIKTLPHSRTYITYVISAPAVGGIVTSRDFIDTHDWEIQKRHVQHDDGADSSSSSPPLLDYVLAGIGLDSDLYPHPENKQYIRGLNGPAGFVMEMVRHKQQTKQVANQNGSANATVSTSTSSSPSSPSPPPVSPSSTWTLFTVIIDTDVRGWLPTSVVQQGMPQTIVDYCNMIRDACLTKIGKTFTPGQMPTTGADKQGEHR